MRFLVDAHDCFRLQERLEEMREDPLVAGLRDAIRVVVYDADARPAHWRRRVGTDRRGLPRREIPPGLTRGRA